VTKKFAQRVYLISNIKSKLFWNTNSGGRREVESIKRKLNLKILSLNIFLIILNLYDTASAQMTDTAWVSRYNTSGSYQSAGNSIVADKFGNLYITGNTNVSINNFDMITIKYNSSGNQLWERHHSIGLGNDYGRIIAADSNQDVIVCGWGDGLSATTLIKYNSAGDSLWTEIYQRSSTHNYVVDMKLDSIGNIYLLLNTAQSGYDEATILKYLPNGSLQYERHYSFGAGYTNEPYNLILDDDCFYVSMRSSNGTIGFTNLLKYDIISFDTIRSSRIYDGWVHDMTKDNSHNIIITGEANSSLGYYTAKFNSQGDTLWSRTYPRTPFNTWASFVLTDSEDNVFVSGQSSLDSIITIKYNPDGIKIWDAFLAGPGYAINRPSTMIIDNENNCYVAGIISNSLSYTQYFTSKYNPAGDQLWTMTYNPSENHHDVLNGMAKDNYDNIYVTGISWGINHFDCTTIKYSKTVGIESENEETKLEYELYQNFPNPFNPKTVINYQLLFSSEVKLKIYNILGNEIEVLINEKQNSGSYSITFDGSDRPSGVYLYRLEIDGNVMDTKRMVLLK